MITIYKYEIPRPLPYNRLVFKVDRPILQVLHIGVQHNKLCMWATVNTDISLTPTYLVIAGTGADLGLMAQQLTYKSTVQHDEYVWHVFVLNSDFGERFLKEQNDARPL